jgi:hypothetical protein
LLPVKAGAAIANGAAYFVKPDLGDGSQVSQPNIERTFVLNLQRNLVVSTGFDVGSRNMRVQESTSGATAIPQLTL